MKYLQILLFALICTCSLYGQQGTVYNLYFHDHYYINPAAAGSQGLSVFNIAAKEFWLGFPENTPGTQALVFHTRIKNFGFNVDKRSYYQKRKEGRVGLGAMLYNDINDPIRKTGLLLTYAYHIRLRESNLSFGLSSNTYQVFTNTEEIQLKVSGDPILQELDYFYTSDANFGVYLRSKDYYFNFVVNNLMESKIKFKNNENITDIDSRQYTMFAGYLYKFNAKLTFEPSVLIQMNEKFKNTTDSTYIKGVDIPDTRMDINLKWIYNKRLWAGFGISSNNSLRAFNAFVGVVSDQFDFGYSFQVPINSDLIQYSLGAHEIMFSLKFGQDRFSKYQRFYR